MGRAKPGEVPQNGGVTRRTFPGAGVAAIVAARAGLIERRGAMAEGGLVRPDRGGAEEGRLLARPAKPEMAARAGLQALGLVGPRDGLLYVPAGYHADRPAPLVLLLHGAGGHAANGLTPLRRLADAAGLILLAPTSHRQTWDVLLGGFGPDVAFVVRALEHAFGCCAVDPARLAVGGFSDGASYALSLGLTNGDLFTHVIAFSPGFMAPGDRIGKPSLFLSHGMRDRVLPIDECSRQIVPQVRRAGYDVTYREFDGPHTVPEEVALEAVEWFTPGGGRGGE